MAKTKILFALANTNPEEMLKLDEEFRDTDEQISLSTRGRSLQRVAKVAVTFDSLAQPAGGTTRSFTSADTAKRIGVSSSAARRPIPRSQGGS